MKKTVLFILLILLRISNCEEADFRSSYNNAMNYTCLIVNLEDTAIHSFGSGVVIKIKDNYFIVTACHVIQPIIPDTGVKTIVEIQDINGNKYHSTVPLDSESVLWFDTSMDFALLSLILENFEPEDSTTPLPEVIEPAYLEKIADTVLVGDQVYMLGSRIFEDAGEILKVLKKGIISAIAPNNPIYGSSVYYVDITGNPGMSGGVVFNENGEGVGLISALIVDEENAESQDLTLVIPYHRILELLEDAVK